MLTVLFPPLSRFPLIYPKLFFFDRGLVDLFVCFFFTWASISDHFKLIFKKNWVKA